MSTERSAKERTLASETYLADDPELIGGIERARELVDAFNASPSLGRPHAREILRELLGHLGEDASIRPALNVDYGSQLSIGDRTFANYGLTALDCAPITIGAGSVVTRDVPADVIAVGNPARVIRRL